VKPAPRIVAFLCEWCAYAAADKAGASHQSYPQTLLTVRVPCTGRVEPAMVLQAFREGADGVLVGGCHPGDCHYQSGNFKARRRVAILRNILTQFGLPADRVWLRWISASEGRLFAETINEMTQAVTKMGPVEFKSDWDV